MKKIYKFNLTSHLVGSGKNYPKIVEVPMNIGAKILSVDNQLEKICLWAEVETTSPTENRTFQIFTTGSSLDLYDDFELNYIGSVILQGGTSVAHVYELTAKIKSMG
jgi:hypothetical protein